MNFAQQWDAVTRRVGRSAVLDRGRLLNVVSVVVGLLLWEYLGRYQYPVLLAPPTEIFTAWVDMMQSGRLPNAFADSLKHAMLGYVIAVVIAVPLGILLGRSTLLRWALGPYIDAIYATPVVAYIPLIIVWFGLHFQARVFIVFMLCFFEILIDTQQGIRSMDKGVLEVGDAFDTTWFDKQRKIFFPAALPYIFTGLRLGIGRAIRAMIVAELFLAIVNLGFILESAGTRFNTDVQLAVVVSISVVGVLAQRGVQLVERLVIPWHYLGDSA